MNESTFTTDRRSPPREPLEGDVVVEVDATRIVGPGQNISDDGVFFIADAAIPVKVRLEGSAEVRTGELVRVESMGGGKVGIAVRFPR